MSTQQVTEAPVVVMFTARCTQCRTWVRGPMADEDYCVELATNHITHYDHNTYVEETEA